MTSPISPGCFIWGNISNKKTLIWETPLIIFHSPEIILLKTNVFLNLDIVITWEHTIFYGEYNGICLLASPNQSQFFITFLAGTTMFCDDARGIFDWLVFCSFLSIHLTAPIIQSPQFEFTASFFVDVGMGTGEGRIVRLEIRFGSMQMVKEWSEI